MGVLDPPMSEIWTPMGIYSGADFSPASRRSVLGGRKGSSLDPWQWCRFGDYNNQNPSTMQRNKRHEHILNTDKGDRKTDSFSDSNSKSEGTSPPSVYMKGSSKSFPAYERLLQKGFVDIPIQRSEGSFSNTRENLPSTRSSRAWNKQEAYSCFQSEVGCNSDKYMDWGTFLNADLDSDVSEIEEQEVENANDPWIPSLYLTQQDREDLVKGRMLSDKHIYAAQKLLHEEFPEIGGLQDPCLAQTEFQPCQQEGLQIHHTRGNHWCVSSSIGGRIIIYDSMYYDIKPDLQNQLNQIYKDFAKEENGDVIYEMPYIPKQKGSRDCALFCIAIAYELCCNNDIREIKFDQSKLRSHLKNCFEQGKLRPFPRLS